MVNIEECCNSGSGQNMPQPGTDRQHVLLQAIKRAERAQRHLREAVNLCGAAAGTENIARNSSESESEAAVGAGRFGAGCRSRPYPYKQSHGIGLHGRALGPHEEWAGMRGGFPQGRHRPGFLGFGAFPGAMRHPHFHPHAHPHPHPHPHHHHHHGHGHGHGHFGDVRMHPFGRHAGHCERSDRPGYGHGHGPAAGGFGRHFNHFGMGHASGHRERAHSCPGV